MRPFAPFVGLSERQRAGGVTLALGLLLLLLYQQLLFQVGAPRALGGLVLGMLIVGALIWIELGLTALILAMLFSPELEIGQLTQRPLTLRLEDVLIPVILLAWFARTAWQRDASKPFKLHPALLPLAVWLAIATISTLRGAGAGRVDLATGAFYILKQLEFFGIFVFTLQYISSLRHLRWLVGFALVTAVLLGLYNFGRLGSTEVWTHNRITAPFEGQSPEPSSIGGYLAFSMAIMISLLLYSPKGRRLWLIVALAVVFPPFILTLSRTSYVAFIAMLVLIALKTRNKKLLGGLAAAALAAPFLAPERVVDRVMYTFNDHTKILGVFDRSFGERIYIWYKVRWNFLTHPFLGWGVTYLDIIDSSYARMLVETGLVGTLAYLAALAQLLRTSLRLERDASLWWLRGLALGYTVGLCGLLVHALTAVTFNIVRIMEPFWLVSGAVAAASLLVANGQERHEPGYLPEPVSHGSTRELPGRSAHPDLSPAR